MAEGMEQQVGLVFCAGVAFIITHYHSACVALCLLGGGQVGSQEWPRHPHNGGDTAWATLEAGGSVSACVSIPKTT